MSDTEPSLSGALSAFDQAAQGSTADEIAAGRVLARAVRVLLRFRADLAWPGDWAAAMEQRSTLLDLIDGKVPAADTAQAVAVAGTLEREQDDDAVTCAACGASLDESDTGLWEDADAPPSADLDSRRYCDESSDHLHDPEFDFNDEDVNATRTSPRTWTVLGLWDDDDDPIALGAVAGKQAVYGDFEQDAWNLTVTAPDAGTAMMYARAGMLAALEHERDADNDDEERSATCPVGHSTPCLGCTWCESLSQAEWRQRYADLAARRAEDNEEPAAADRIALVRLDIARIGDDRERSQAEGVLAAWLEGRDLPGWDSMTPLMQATAFQLARIRPFTTERN